MRPFVLVTLACVAVLLCACRAPARPAPLPASWHTTTQDLRSVTCFAFGGVGIAGVTSEGELAFRAVLTGTNALPLFKSILTNGTTEAKLYALCGIRLLSSAEFDQLAAPLLSAAPIATTMSGCLVFHEPTPHLITRINRGFYDGFLNW